MPTPPGTHRKRPRRCRVPLPVLGVAAVSTAVLCTWCALFASVSVLDNSFAAPYAWRAVHGKLPLALGGGNGTYASIEALRTAGAHLQPLDTFAGPPRHRDVAGQPLLVGKEALRVPFLRAGDVPAVGFSPGFMHLARAPVLEAALALGHRLIYTAAYWGTRLEGDVGVALGDAFAAGLPRDRLFVSSKVLPAATRGSVEVVKDSVRGSMQRMRIGHLDLLMLHGLQCQPEFARAAQQYVAEGDTVGESCDLLGEEVRTSGGDYRTAWAAMQQLRREGLVRYLGVSHTDDVGLMETLWSKAPQYAADGEDVAAAQPAFVSGHYTLYQQARGLRQWCANRGVVFLAHGLFGYNYAGDCYCPNGALYCDGTTATRPGPPGEPSGAPRAAAMAAAAAEREAQSLIAASAAATRQPGLRARILDSVGLGGGNGGSGGPVEAGPPQVGKVAGRGQCTFGKDHLAEAPVLNDPELVRIARSHGVSPARALLRFAIHEGVVPVYTATSTAHMLDDWAVLDDGFALTQRDIKDLRARHGQRDEVPNHSMLGSDVTTPTAPAPGGDSPPARVAAVAADRVGDRARAPGIAQGQAKRVAQEAAREMAAKRMPAQRQAGRPQGHNMR